MVLVKPFDESFLNLSCIIKYDSTLLNTIVKRSKIPGHLLGDAADRSPPDPQLTHICAYYLHSLPLC